MARAPRPRKSVSSLRSTSSMHTQSSSIRALFLSGPTGRLEALLNAGSENATHAALVCHPHPLYGGTLHNKVVFHAMKALNSFGFPVLRFNFRGVGWRVPSADHLCGIFFWSRGGIASCVRGSAHEIRYCSRLARGPARRSQLRLRFPPELYQAQAVHKRRPRSVRSARRIGETGGDLIRAEKADHR